MSKNGSSPWVSPKSQSMRPHDGWDDDEKKNCWSGVVWILSLSLVCFVFISGDFGVVAHFIASWLVIVRWLVGKELICKWRLLQWLAFSFIFHVPSTPGLQFTASGFKGVGSYLHSPQTWWHVFLLTFNIDQCGRCFTMHSQLRINPSLWLFMATGNWPSALFTHSLNNTRHITPSFSSCLSVSYCCICYGLMGAISCWPKRMVYHSGNALADSVLETHNFPLFWSADDCCQFCFILGVH